MRGSEGGREKSTYRGNSLAAYPTACPVWGEEGRGYAAYAAEIREFLTRILVVVHDDVHARLTRRAQEAKGGLALVEQEWQRYSVAGLAPAASRVQMS